MITFIIFVIFLIILGTNFINYYYNFFYMYKQLDNYEKFKYFNNNILIKLISKNSKLKIFITVFILTPLIKINYVLISTLIYLLYALCENEMDNILLKNGIDNTYKKITFNNTNIEDTAPIINFNNTNIEDTAPIINFIKNDDIKLINLNDKLVDITNSPTILKNDVDLFMSIVNNKISNISTNKDNINNMDNMKNMDNIENIENIEKMENIIQEKNEILLPVLNNDIVKQILENIVDSMTDKEHHNFENKILNIDEEGVKIEKDENTKLKIEELSEYLLDDITSENIPVENVISENVILENIILENIIPENIILNEGISYTNILDIEINNLPATKYQEKLLKIEQIETLTMDEIDFGDYMSNLLKQSDENTQKIKEDEDIKEDLIPNVKIPIKIKIGKKKIIN